jgi:hypothetical protein
MYPNLKKIGVRINFKFMGRSWSFFNGDAVGGTQLAGTQLAWDAVGWDAVGGTRLVGRSWRDAIVPPREKI